MMMMDGVGLNESIPDPLFCSFFVCSLPKGTHANVKTPLTKPPTPGLMLDGNARWIPHKLILG